MSDLSNSTVSISQLARREKMVNSIQAGFPFQLRLVEKIRDRSAPCIEGGCVKKLYDRRPLMTSICGAVQLKVLKYEQINDRSAPKIDPSVHIQYVERKAFLDTVLVGASDFYHRMMSVMITGVKTAGDVARVTSFYAQVKAGQIASDVSSAAKETAHTAQHKAEQLASDVSAAAKETAHTAQAKAGGILESGKEKAADIIEAGKDTAHAAQVRANDILETGQEKAAAVRTSAKRRVASVRYTWNDLYNSGKEILLSKQSVELNTDAHRQLIADISANRQVLLNHVESSDINDRSKPFIATSQRATVRILENRTRVMSEIQHKATVKSLNHVSTRDGSKPAVAQISIKQHDRKALLAEVEADAAQLHPASNVCDRSAPALPQGPIDLQKTAPARKAILKELEKGVDLHANPLVKDRSAPQLPSM